MFPWTGKAPGNASQAVMDSPYEAKDIRELFHDLFPVCTITSIHFRGTWIKTTYLLRCSTPGGTEQGYYLKICEKPEWTDLEHERSVVELLRSVNIHLPRVEVVDTSCSYFPKPFLVQRQGQGTRLSDLWKTGDPRTRQEWYRAIGEFYSRVHGLKNSWAGVWKEDPAVRAYPITPNAFMFRAEIVEGSGRILQERGVLSPQLHRQIIALWEKNMEFLESATPTLTHVSPFPWSLYLVKEGGSWHVSKVTALGDFTWWDADLDCTLLRWPPFAHLSEDEWNSFLEGYARTPCSQKMQLFSLLTTLCAIAGVYMEPASLSSESWKKEAGNE
ncbi:MAG TPA: phosphotransferase, partial [Thermotogota bacterium]|nr:phosphotransferase [Thermotogota bacterium]